MLDSLEPRRLLASIGLDTTYGENGTVLLGRAAGDDTATAVAAAAVAPGGTLYYVQAVTYGVDETSPTFDFLRRVDAAGRPDRAFNAKNVRVGSPTSFDTAIDQLVVAPDGRRLALLTDNGVRQYTDGGVARTTADKNLTAVRNGRGLIEAAALAYDAAGRLVVAGLFTVDAAGTRRLAVGRFNADGTPDTTFADAGLRVLTDAANPSTFDPQNAIVLSVAVAADNAMAVATTSTSTTQVDDVIDSSDRGVTVSVIRRDGKLVASAVETTDSQSSNEGGILPGYARAADLRPIDGNRFAYAISTGLVGDTGLIGTVRGDGTGATRENYADVRPTSLRLDNAGRPVPVPGPSTGAFDAPAATRATRDIDVVFGGDFFVLPDGDVLAVGRAGGQRIAAQRFDGAPAETNATPGTARVINRGTTLSVRGTGANDVIGVFFRSRAARVTLNGTPLGTFARGTFYDIRVEAGDGDDAVAVRFGETRRGDSVDARGIYIAGGAGNDTLSTDATNGDVRGEAGDDTIRAGNDRMTVTGGDGRDTLIGRHNLDGGSGDDVLRAAAFVTATTLVGGNGDDRLICPAGVSALLLGEDGDDLLLDYSDGAGVDGGSGQDIAYVPGAGVASATNVEVVRRRR